MEDLACPVVLTSSGCASGYLPHDHHDIDDHDHDHDHDSDDNDHDGSPGHLDDHDSHNDSDDDEDNESHNNHDEHKQLLPMMFTLQLPMQQRIPAGFSLNTVQRKSCRNSLSTLSLAYLAPKSSPP